MHFCIAFNMMHTNKSCIIDSVGENVTKFDNYVAMQLLYYRCSIFEKTLTIESDETFDKWLGNMGIDFCYKSKESRKQLVMFKISCIVKISDYPSFQNGIPFSLINLSSMKTMSTQPELNIPLLRIMKHINLDIWLSLSCFIRILSTLSHQRPMEKARPVKVESHNFHN